MLLLRDASRFQGKLYIPSCILELFLINIGGGVMVSLELDGEWDDDDDLGDEDDSDRWD